MVVSLGVRAGRIKEVGPGLEGSGRGGRGRNQCSSTEARRRTASESHPSAARWMQLRRSWVHHRREPRRHAATVTLSLSLQCHCSLGTSSWVGVSSFRFCRSGVGLCRFRDNLRRLHVRVDIGQARTHTRASPARSHPPKARPPFRVL